VAKGAVGLVAGYWPEDVYRYLATPNLYLDEGLVSRQAKRRATSPAILGDSGVLTYESLATEVDRAMKAILALLGGQGSRVAVGVPDPLDSLKIFFGALQGRCGVLLMDPTASVEALFRQIRSFKPHLIVAGGVLLEKVAPLGSGQGIRIVTAQELWQQEGGGPKTKLRVGLKAAAVALAEESGHLVYHSHSSLLAGALSWSTFVALKEDEALLSMKPLHTWEGLYSVLPALFRGGACVLTAERGPTLVSLIRRYRPSYVLVPIGEAFQLALDHAVVGEIQDALRGIFVSVTEPFRAAERRKLKALLGKPVLTVYGRAETGPVLASHPDWHLGEAAGIPVTNVDVWPLNPTTGNPLQVPWEAIEHAEIGVKSPMTAVEYERPEATQERVREGWLRTKVVAAMDPSGLFYLLSRVE
jgi:acyl-CoA synthetase (AMP-forming)/AMP-acid ligase II